MAEAFDTLTAAEKLQNGGFSEDQSKAIAHVLGDAITGNVATKSDIASLRSDIENLRETTKGDIENLRETTKADLNNLGNTLRAEMKTLKSELKLWMVSAIAIGIGLLKALDYLLPSAF